MSLEYVLDYAKSMLEGTPRLTDPLTERYNPLA